MRLSYLPIVVSLLLFVGCGVFWYKAFVLRFPLKPDVKLPYWSIEAEVTFIGRGKPAKISLHIPKSTPSILVMDESFVSYGYGLATEISDGNRVAKWATRKSQGKGRLYYRALVRRIPPAKRPITDVVDDELEEFEFEGAEQAAAEELVTSVTDRSADRQDQILELLRVITSSEPSSSLRILLGRKPSGENKAALAVKLFSLVDIRARMMRGIRLVDQTKDAILVHWLEIYNPQEKIWESYDPVAVKKGIPDDYFAWASNEVELVKGTGVDKLNVAISVNRSQELAISSALATGRKSNLFWSDYSLFALPIHVQAIYRIMLVIPIGALIVVFLRNVVGLNTFGTFMPVLIALAFRETQLMWGVVLFVMIVAFGLLVRFFLEQLKLLLVPRLTAVLIVVVLSMVGLSVVGQRVGFEQGLSVGLFPLVIITMTIERISVVWEEEGPRYAILQGIGSLIAAALCYQIMSQDILQHIAFVFPETLLVVLAVVILLGRYTGYRLLELFRFKAFGGF